METDDVANKIRVFEKGEREPFNIIMIAKRLKTPLETITPKDIRDFAETMVKREGFRLALEGQINNYANTIAQDPRPALLCGEYSAFNRILREVFGYTRDDMLKGVSKTISATHLTNVKFRELYKYAETQGNLLCTRKFQGKSDYSDPKTVVSVIKRILELGADVMSTKMRKGGSRETYYTLVLPVVPQE